MLFSTANACFGFSRVAVGVGVGFGISAVGVGSGLWTLGVSTTSAVASGDDVGVVNGVGSPVSSRA